MADTGAPPPVVTNEPVPVTHIMTPHSATPVHVAQLVNGSCGTQLRDAFKIIGIDLDEFCPPGASNPGVYNGVQVVDAFKAYNKKHPDIIDMNTISVGMKGTQVADAFRAMAAPTPAVVIP